MHNTNNKDGGYSMFKKIAILSIEYGNIAKKNGSGATI